MLAHVSGANTGCWHNVQPCRPPVLCHEKNRPTCRDTGHVVPCLLVSADTSQHDLNDVKGYYQKRIFLNQHQYQCAEYVTSPSLCVSVHMDISRTRDLSSPNFAVLVAQYRICPGSQEKKCHIKNSYVDWFWGIYIPIYPPIATPLGLASAVDPDGRGHYSFSCAIVGDALFAVCLVDIR